MENIFLSVLNMSLTGSYVIAAIMLARLLLKKSPKTVSYVLWAVAGFRLIFPFSFESVFSLIPFNSTPIPADIAMQPIPRVDSGIPMVDNAVSYVLPAVTPAASVNPLQICLTVGSYLWFTGIAIMLIYSIISIIVLKRRLNGAMPIAGNIYKADNLKTPFLLGLFRPIIYIPGGLSEEERHYIVLHERTHIRRGDHIVKFFAYFIFCLHWFNPLVWAAFLLMITDMEMSCDECVLKEMGSDIKKAYSTSLLSLATGQHLINSSPLAFGEGNIKRRIKNVLNFKKSAAWVSIAAIVFVIVLTAGFATSRADNTEQDLSMLNIENLAEISYQMDELLVSQSPNSNTSLNISARAVAEYLDSVKWTEKKMDSSLELSADLKIQWNEDQELQFYDAEPLLAMVRMNEQRRYYTIGEDDYEKMLKLIGTASGPQSNTSQVSESGQESAPNVSQKTLEPTVPKWSPEQSVDTIGIPELDYASDDIVIFHGYFGLFVYDLDSQQIVRSLDLKPLNCAAIQGDDYCEVTVSTDGNMVQLHRLSSENMYVYNVSDNTLLETKYERMNDRFGSNFVPIEDVVDTDYLGNYSYNAVKFDKGKYGYLYISDWTLGTLSYVRGDISYSLFD